MKIFKKVKSENGHRKIYFLGVKIFSYQRAHSITENNIVYGKEFYAKQAAYSYQSARIVLNEVRRVFNFNSLIDIGCGVGTWLKAAQELGVSEIQGVDGNTIDEQFLYVPRTSIKVEDLNTFDKFGTKNFELAMSLEVAEHLNPSSSQHFIDILTSYSDVVLFSAGIPFQAGVNHINCQPLQFWVNLFAVKDYQCFDFLRKSLLDYDEAVNCCYIQNTLLFVHSSKVDLFLKQGFVANQKPTLFYHWKYVNIILNKYAKLTVHDS